ncbi:DNA glycosylase, partial [Piedraia hortae CBS 480.64]
KKATIKAEKEDPGDVNDLPHNLGTALPDLPVKRKVEDDEDGEVKVSRRKINKSKIKEEDGDGAEVKDVKVKTPKKANYGLTPGISPYPDYARPTPEECEEVTRLLSAKHGVVNAPKAVPPPSLTVAGCGEVPSVLDALIRTRLSANTTGKNSSAAFQGLVRKFGTIPNGVGKGSVDWDAVRRAPLKDVYKAIACGGLADRKSRDIQAILQMAWDENRAAEPDGADVEHTVISLDHIHAMTTDDAINKMLTFPGIGPKTASCVALFCLQRPSFAVDTHVFRLCRYLGWVPTKPGPGQPRIDRNTAFAHCDARVPDRLKYPLHQLFIKHGKECGRCRAITGTGSKDWDNTVCPIEHLVHRHGARKGGKKERKLEMMEEGMPEATADQVAEEEVAAAKTNSDSELTELE